MFILTEKTSSMAFKTAQIQLVSSHPEVYEPCDDSFALVDALISDTPNLLAQILIIQYKYG